MTRFVVIAGLVLAAACSSARAADAAKIVAPFTLNDTRGATVHSADFANSKCLVVAFLGTECPLAKLYGPRLQTLANEYEPKGVRFLAINSNQQDSIAEITASVKQHEIKYAIL